jgi:hypothetical protein
MRSLLKIDPVCDSGQAEPQFPIVSNSMQTHERAT